MIQLSIIIPIYNVEPYIERCLRSLEDQDIPKKDYEIICINDGSPDNSKEIVRKMQGEYSNIILINQENQGVSMARNNGIDKAIGKYLMFIDPDDFVDNNCFSRILRKVDNKKAQVSFLGFTFLNKNSTVRNQVFYENQTTQIYEGVEAYFVARGDGQIDPDRIWAILFETSFLNRNNLRYLPDVPYLEDGEFIARILCLAESCIFDGNSFYQRTTRPGSATNSKLFCSEKATKGFLLAASNLKSFQLEEVLNEKQRTFLNQPILKFVLLAVNSAIGWRLLKKLLITLKDLKKLGLRKVKLEGCNREIRIYGTAYNLSPWLGALTLVLYARLEKLLLFIIPRKKDKKLIL